MKKYFILLMIISLCLITACSKKENPNISFKNDYEEINGKENASGKIHRSVNIPEDNPMEEVNPSDIVKKIENKETFYVYFGSRLCPWCRSVIESAIKVANTRGISKIYYVDVWDDDGKEIMRDKYTLDDKNNPVLEQEGTDDYKKLIQYFDSMLRDYNLTDANGNNILVGEKRIYAPNFMFVSEGVLKKLINGKSDKLTDSREELTDEIRKAQEELFDDFFTEVCDEEC